MSNEEMKKMLNDDDLDDVVGGAGTQGKFEEIDGTVREALPYFMYIVDLDNGEVVKAALAGVMREYYVHVYVGDRVVVKRIAADGSNPRISNKYRTA